MTGLSVLYASEAAKERDWEAVPDRDRTGRLREVYWARRAESKSGRNRSVNATLNWRLDRSAIGRRGDEPGDGFIYLVRMTPQVEERFEWIEVTEVFTTVQASRIEAAMRAWNGIPDKQPLDFEGFRKNLRQGRPSRTEQRSAADRVIAQIERKLVKASYRELLEKYGYGTLVVGMPLWFAVRPDDPCRLASAIDDFMTRTALGLEDVKRRLLRRRDCPFRKVIVVWDTTPQALREWRDGRSSEYEDAGNASLENPMGVGLVGALSDGLEKGISKTRIPESQAPSMGLRLDTETVKRVSGKGPYPELVVAFGEVLREGDEHRVGRWPPLKSKLALALLKLLCFVRIHGLEGLERRVVRRLSVSHAWRKVASRRLYRESRRRGRAFAGLGLATGLTGVGEGLGRRRHLGAGERHPKKRCKNPLKRRETEFTFRLIVVVSDVG